ncbi:MAG: PIN domain-containing protein [Planctomycetes bacterium]|nr:PIN domain-containing protein [Planctomycetota bacterium]
MIAYLDSSVVLRTIFGEPGRLAEIKDVEHAVSSELLKVECLRTIDRLRIQVPLSDKDVAFRNEAVFQVLRATELVLLSPPILDRASQPFPTTVRTLDALHLASALLWRQGEGKDLTVLTHDRELGLAARAVGFQVLGC